LAVLRNSYFLHSRYLSPKDKGDYIWPEHLCLTKLFPQQQKEKEDDQEADNPTSPCLIYRLSDQDLSVTLLTNAIRNATSCQVQTAQDKATGESFFSAEHGPFAGRGFWQDIAMASQTRRGMIAFHKRVGRSYVRTSSALIRERVEFRRVLELMTVTTGGSDGSSSRIKPFVECTNPWKNK
jgi:hypothetical protein